MKCACLIIGVCAAFPLFARTTVTVSGLVDMVTSDLAVDRNDERIAKSVQAVQLTDRLVPETVLLLVELGVGSDTARALGALLTQSARLPLPAEPPISVTPLPSDEAKSKMLNAARLYALEYLTHLPNFVATKAVHKYRNYERVVDDQWHKVGEYTTEATHSATRGRSPISSEKGGGRRPEGSISEGEFGGMMTAVFEPHSAASFTWDRWQLVNGTRMAVFNYRAPEEYSHFTLCCRKVDQPNGNNGEEDFPVAHRGTVFIDPRTGAVRRIVIYATGLTGNSPVSAAGDILDYGEVHIGNDRYMLPVRSIAYIRVGPFESRDDVDYHNFHKFSTESALDFGDSADKARPKN
jgi:hypothetical protein